MRVAKRSFRCTECRNTIYAGVEVRRVGRCLCCVGCAEKLIERRRARFAAAILARTGDDGARLLKARFMSEV